MPVSQMQSFLEQWFRQGLLIMYLTEPLFQPVYEGYIIFLSKPTKRKQVHQEHAYLEQARQELVRQEQAYLEQARQELVRQELARQELVHQELAPRELARASNKKCVGHYVKYSSYCSICHEVAKTTFCVDGGNIHLCDMCTHRRLQMPSYVTWPLQFGSVAECPLNKQ